MASTEQAAGRAWFKKIAKKIARGWTFPDLAVGNTGRFRTWFFQRLWVHLLKSENVHYSCVCRSTMVLSGSGIPIKAVNVVYSKQANCST
jgi:hypothetical protein